MDNKDILAGIGEQIAAQAQSRDYGIEPWELDRVLKVVTKIVSLATSLSYMQAYEKGKAALRIAYSILEAAESKKSAGAATPDGQSK